MNGHAPSRLSPQKLLFWGFIIIIVLGTGALMLPASTTQGISITDAFFTAASAACVTGLIVKSTPADFTVFGQVVILVLIQIGGLGYMSMATFIALLAGKRIGISQRILIKESLNMDTLEGITRLLKGMFLFVLLAETFGIIIFFMKFSNESVTSGVLLQSVFHSISAFNNAGFSLFENSLISYRGDIMINLTVISLIILGGIGFIVVDDLYGWFAMKEHRLMLHTRIAVTTTLILIVAGAILFFITERHYLLQDESLTASEVILSPVFASVTARTAGFHTIDYSLLQPSTLFLSIILMAIGGSPGSTAGGIKTTTFSVIVMNIVSIIRGKKDTVMFRSRIPEDLIFKSLVIMSIGFMYIALITFIIVGIEHTPFLKTLFEVVSAFGTVGLSFGDGGSHSFCAGFSDLSKWIIIVTMIAGRLGPLAIFAAFLKQKDESLRYPEGRIMIG
jgi:trk system potassium uptake protein TrkH